MISEKLSIIHSVDGGSVYPECAYTIVMITFLLVVVVCLFFSACFLFLSIQRKIIDNKKFDSEQTKDYYQGYIQGADDRKNNTTPSAPGSKNHDYLQGYIDGHKDDKFWK